ncbi:MAG: glycosyltransferase family 4 protein [Leptolyngbyaceae cyanobacterium SM2_5_2]|nr:glycosyltransferase family 4 protein [Leptolyngbyaceae cyanobacterium SM2_5_2]
MKQVTVVIGDWQTDYFGRSFSLSSSKIKLIDVAIQNRSISRNLWFLRELPKLANQLKPDIIHLSFPFPIIRRWFNAPIVATIHDLYPFEYPQNFGYPQVWFNQGFLRQCVDQSDGLSCVSQVTLDSLKLHFPKLQDRKPLKVIYNSVDFSNKLSNLSSRLTDFSDKPFILGVAQHRKNKNLNLLIQAYHRLRESGNISANIQLLLVGSPGPETQALHGLVQSLHLNSKVTFLSGLSDEELRWMYEQAELFVMPSSTEGFCLPLVEAQTLGCPIVCSNIPIFHEIASPYCHFFSLENTPISNLTQAIYKAISKPKNRQSFVNSSFLSSTVAQQYLNLYQLVSA